jgi:hypothetical protein
MADTAVITKFPKAHRVATPNGKRTKIAKGEQSARPYRLWDAKQKKNLRGRNYKYKYKAQIGALIEAKFAHVGTTIEVYDVYGRLYDQYTRRPDGVKIG